jgi:hypothetical protein
MKVKCELDVISFYYPYHKELKKEVCEYLKKCQYNHGKNTNVKAAITDWDITTPQIEKLKTFMISNISMFGLKMPNRFNFLFESFWANVYEKGDFAESHTHAPCFLSSIYFLSIKRNYSPLIFSDSKTKITPEEGKFLLFPSIMKHEVPKHKHDEKRITLAGNIIWQNK